MTDPVGVYLVDTGELWWVVARDTGELVNALNEYETVLEPILSAKRLESTDLVEIMFDPTYGVESATMHGVPLGVHVDEEDGLVRATVAAWAELVAPRAPTILAAERWAP